MKPHLLCAVWVVTIFHAMGTLAIPSPKIIVGFASGELKRCEFSDVTQCETLSDVESPVMALTVVGEFVYIGLLNGEVRRCSLYEPSDCQPFHETYSDIYSITASGKHIYISTTDGIIKCGLRKSEDCDGFFFSDTPVYSLATHENTLYAGTDYAVLSCSLDTVGACTEYITNTTSTVNAIAFYDNMMYLGLKEGSVEFCELSNMTDYNNDLCFSIFITHAEIKSIEVFENEIQTNLENGEILRFSYDKNETLTVSPESFSEQVLSMVTVYDTKPVYRHYLGESTGCTWQFFACPPYIIYYDVDSRSALELRVKNGLIYNTDDELFDTQSASFSHSGRSAIFVMDAAGRLFASVQHPILLLHHSSLMNGKPAAAAGEITAEDGVIKDISSCSGHYRPPVELVKQVLSSLKRQGYSKEVKIIDCNLRRDLLIDLDFNKTEFYYKAKYEEYSRKMAQMKK